MKNALLLLIAGLAVGAVAYWGFTVSNSIKGVEISSHGMYAMIGGLVVTLVVGVGLMALLFLSNRNGHDEEVHYLNTPHDTEDK